HGPHRAGRYPEGQRGRGDDQAGQARVQGEVDRPEAVAGGALLLRPRAAGRRRAGVGVADLGRAAAVTLRPAPPSPPPWGRGELGRERLEPPMFNLLDAVRRHCPELAPALVERHFRCLPAAYFDRYSAAEIARHVRLLAPLAHHDPVAVEVRPVTAN